MARSQVVADATERFPGNITSHKITILQDSGVHRHIRFRDPASLNYWFELVTWPGCLAIQGDMGCYVFGRTSTSDMFTMFRDSRQEYDYWAGKVIASGATPREYSPDQVREAVMDWAQEFDDNDDDWSGRGRQLMTDVMAEELRDIDLLGEGVVMQLLAGIKYRDGAGRKVYPFEYCADWDFTEFRFHFVWCCLAITWGISEYDKHKALAPIPVQSRGRRLLHRLIGRSA